MRSNINSTDKIEQNKSKNNNLDALKNLLKFQK